MLSGLLLDKSITFTASQVPQIRKILELADVNAMTSEMYCDSNKVTTIGNIDRYRFDYHYSIINRTTKIHGITVFDPIDSTEVYISRYDKFVDVLMLERELTNIYYE